MFVCFFFNALLTFPRQESAHPPVIHTQPGAPASTWRGQRKADLEGSADLKAVLEGRQAGGTLTERKVDFPLLASSSAVYVLHVFLPCFLCLLWSWGCV